jgi:predicted DNA binding protein
MRYVTVLIRPPEALTIHPTEAPVARDSSLTRVAYHRVDLLDDGTFVVLIEMRGDKDRYREILDDAEAVYDYTISGGDNWYSYVHVEPNSMLREYWEAQRESEVILEMPVEIVDNHVYRVTYVGRETQFRDELELLDQMVDYEILRTGTYRPDVGQLLGELTERQREILEVAHEEGYYEDPRQTTHGDIADLVGCSSATVGEHLRKIEAQVMEAIAP